MDITKFELLKELQRLRNKEKRTPTTEIMRKRGEYSVYAYSQKFGSWNSALEKADLNLNEEKGITKDDLISEIKRVSEKFCNKHSPTQRDIKRKGKYSPETYLRVIGGWNQSLKLAGFDINIKQNQNIQPEELLEEIKRLEDGLSDKQTIKQKHMREKGEYSLRPYFQQFGSWRNAVKKAGLTPNKQHPSGDEHPFWRGGTRNYYGPSWNKQRKKALERDNYSCVVCGREKIQGKRNIHVHHIIPKYFWNVRREHHTMNSMDNLVCLCREHHWEVETDNMKKFTYNQFLEEVNSNE